QNRMYDWGATSLINNRSRVYKGGSWRDRAYWIIPGTRRFLDERLAMSTLGFRCAMTRVGSPTGFTQE
ncbi:MAG: gliding motility lipoprotein GldJ, partial [Bacteroidota bacterium]